MKKPREVIQHGRIQHAPLLRHPRRAPVRHGPERRGLYSKAALIEHFGADANMVALRLELAADCPKVIANKIMDLCVVYYPDRIGR